MSKILSKTYLRSHKYNNLYYIYTVNKKRMIKGKIEVFYLYKVFSLYILRDYCTLKA